MFWPKKDESITKAPSAPAAHVALAPVVAETARVAREIPADVQAARKAVAMKLGDFMLDIEFVEPIYQELLKVAWEFPASRDRHHAERFGLIVHSLNVYTLALVHWPEHFSTPPNAKISWAEKVKVYLLLTCLGHDLGKILEWNLNTFGIDFDIFTGDLRAFPKPFEIKEKREGINYRTSASLSSVLLFRFITACPAMAGNYFDPIELIQVSDAIARHHDSGPFDNSYWKTLRQADALEIEQYNKKLTALALEDQRERQRDWIEPTPGVETPAPAPDDAVLGETTDSTLSAATFEDPDDPDGFIEDIAFEEFAPGAVSVEPTTFDDFDKSVEVATFDAPEELMPTPFEEPVPVGSSGGAVPQRKSAPSSGPIAGLGSAAEQHLISALRKFCTTTLPKYARSNYLTDNGLLLVMAPKFVRDWKGAPSILLELEQMTGVANLDEKVVVEQMFQLGLARRLNPDPARDYTQVRIDTDAGIVENIYFLALEAIKIFTAEEIAAFPRAKFLSAEASCEFSSPEIQVFYETYVQKMVQGPYLTAAVKALQWYDAEQDTLAYVDDKLDRERYTGSNGTLLADHVIAVAKSALESVDDLEYAPMLIVALYHDIGKLMMHEAKFKTAGRNHVIASAVLASDIKVERRDEIKKVILASHKEGEGALHRRLMAAHAAFPAGEKIST
jgi:hypothetical protein